MNHKIILSDLRLYRVFLEEIEECKRDLERNAQKKDTLAQPRSPSFSDEPKVRPLKSWDDYLTDLLDEERHIKERWMKYESKIRELDSFIDQLEDDARELVKMKYVKGCTWAECQERFHLSRAMMDKIIRQGIEKSSSATK